MTCEIQVFADGIDYSEDADNTLSIERQAPGGSYRVAWQTHFKAHPTMPRRFSPVRVMDTASGACIWYGRMDQWSIADFDGCQGVISMTAIGLSAALSDRAFRKKTRFGPRGAYFPAAEDPPQQILFPRDAVIYALTQLAPSVFPGNIANPGGQLTSPTQNWGGRTARDVIEFMTGLYAYLGTPLLWSVKPLGGATGGYFCWEFLNTSVAYTVNVGAGHGTQMSIASRPSELYNEALVPWGTDSVALAPDPSLLESLDYSRVPSPLIRSKVAGLNGRESSWVNASHLAHSILTRQNSMNFGWGITLKIPRGEKITGVTHPWMVEEGKTIRIVGLNAGDWPSGEMPPTEIFITNVKYDSSQGELTITGGEPLDVAAVNTLRTIGATSIATADVVKSPSAQAPSPDGSGSPLPPRGPAIPGNVALSPVTGGGGQTLGGSAAPGANNIPGYAAAMYVPPNSAIPGGDPLAVAATAPNRPDGSHPLNMDTGATSDELLAVLLPLYTNTIPIMLGVELQTLEDGGCFALGPCQIIEYKIITNPDVAAPTFELRFCQTTSTNEKFRVSIAAGDNREKKWTKLTTPLDINDLDVLYYRTTVVDVTDKLWAMVALRYIKWFPGHPNVAITDIDDPTLTATSIKDVRAARGKRQTP
jgi:hypothetical protein